MKLKKTFLVNQIAGETVGVSVAGGFNGIVKANSSAAFLLDCLKKEISEEALVKKLTDTYDVSPETAAADLKTLLAQLRSVGALEE